MSERTQPAVAAGSDLAAGERRGTVGQRARAFLVAVVSWLAQHVPEGLGIGVAEAGGELWYRAAPARARRARRNLGRVAAYLDRVGLGSDETRRAAGDPRALERLVRRAFRHAARYYLEVARIPAMTAATIREALLIETPEVVEEAFGADRPVIFVGAHFGSVEVPALYLAQRTGLRATVPMETVGDPELQRYFVRTRGRVGLRIVGLREARRELVASLRRGESVGLVGDRDISGGGLQVPFFGAPAPLPIGPALLAIETGAPIYLVAVRRAGRGRYRARVRAIPVAADGSRRDRLNGTLTALARGFEEAIAVAPEQWWAAFFPIWPDLDGPGRNGQAAAGPTTDTPSPGGDR